MKKLLAMKWPFFMGLIMLIASMNACTSFSKIDIPAGETGGGDGNGTGGLGSVSGSLSGTFNMGSVVSATFNENEDKTLWVLLADGEICCSCGSNGKQEVDASMILLNGLPNEQGTFEESTDNLGMEMYLLTATEGSTSSIVDNTSNVSISIESTSDSEVTGSYTGTFGTSDVVSGTFKATKCLSGN